MSEADNGSNDAISSGSVNSPTVEQDADAKKKETEERTREASGSRLSRPRGKDADFKALERELDVNNSDDEQDGGLGCF